VRHTGEVAQLYGISPARVGQLCRYADELQRFAREHAESGGRSRARTLRSREGEETEPAATRPDGAPYSAVQTADNMGGGTDAVVGWLPLGGARIRPAHWALSRERCSSASSFVRAAWQSSMDANLV